MASRKSRRAKPSMGRPPLPRDELRRHRVVVHLTDVERDTLAALAQERDSDLGAMARELLGVALKRALTRKGS